MAVEGPTERLRAAVARIAGSYGLELFDVQFRRESSGWVLRVILDTPWPAPSASEGSGAASVPASERARGPGAQPPSVARERSASAPRERSGAAGVPASERVGGPGAQPPEVTIDDCQRVSQDLSALLDVEEETLGLPDVKYTLEVSSPGLDRPLRGDADYRRFQDRLAKIVTVEPVEGQSSFAGRLAGVEDGRVLLTEGRRTHRIPLALIKRARLDVEF